MTLVVPFFGIDDFRRETCVQYRSALLCLLEYLGVKVAFLWGNLRVYEFVEIKSEFSF